MSNGVSILQGLCTEEVYRKNAFHVIGLSSVATPKQIRRRREDLEAARDLGVENWKSEFRHWIGSASIPNEEEVNAAFGFLEDPAQRIVSEFFWFWPLGDDDDAVSDALSGNLSAAMEKWASASLRFGRRRSIALHNLAVVYHLRSIDGEMQLLSGHAVGRDVLEEQWTKCFAYWEELADEDSFWEIYEARMRESDDPRLTGGFIRRIREEFPIAFDNINANLALMYARKGDEQNAKRHVAYMKKTMSSIDDVEQSFDTLFEPLESQVSRIIKGCDARVAKDAKEGAACVEELLKSSQDIVTAATFLLDRRNQRRTRILAEIFKACNGYLVSYGNSTSRWETCLRLNDRLRPLACTDELLKRVDENGSILRENVERAQQENVCCGCGKHAGQKRLMGSIVTIAKQTFDLYGNVRRNPQSFGGVSYSTLKIDVPCCDKCRSLQSHQVEKFAPIAKALKEGFNFGKEPTKGDMRRAWGLPPTEQTLVPRRVGCIVPLAIIGFVVMLTGCALAKCLGGQ